MRNSTLAAIVRFSLFTLVATTLSAQTYRYDYPSTYACGGTIRARVLSANTSTISFEVQKSTTCWGSEPFNPPNGKGEAQIRANSSTGTILTRAAYVKNDPRVILNVPSFTSGSRTFWATIDAFSAGPITIKVTAVTAPPPDLIASWQQSIPASAVPGTTITLQGQAMNVGGTTAGATNAQFAYATTPALTASNITRIGNPMPVASLAPRASSVALKTSWTIPTALANKTIYVALLTDSSNWISESNEANNFYTPAMTLSVDGAPVVGPLLDIQIGYVAWLHVPDGKGGARPMTETEMRKMVDDLIGNGRRVTLLLSVEIPWADTQPIRGKAADFAPHLLFARICAEKKVRYSPQFSFHYLPQWVRDDYPGDVIAGGTFLPLQPASRAWDTWGPAANWIRAGITAFTADGGRNHFAAGGPIETVLVGNETQFPTKAASTTQAASRALTLAQMLARLVGAARDQLDAYGMQRINVSSKLYPYQYPPHDVLDSSYTAESLKVIHNSFRGVAAFDSYSKSPSGSTCGSHDWLVTHDLDQAKRYGQGLTLFMAEWDYYIKSGDQAACTASMPAQAIVDGIAAGISRGARYFTFFSLNPKDGIHVIRAEQKSGLKRAFYATVGR